MLFYETALTPIKKKCDTLCPHIKCHRATYSEFSNNSSDLLLIFGNFFQQNRLIMVWIIINFYIVFLQNSYFRQNFGFLSQISAFWAGKSKKKIRKSFNRILIVIWIIINFRKIFQQNAYLVRIIIRDFRVCTMVDLIAVLCLNFQAFLSRTSS